MTTEKKSLRSSLAAVLVGLSKRIATILLLIVAAAFGWWLHGDSSPAETDGAGSGAEAHEGHDHEGPGASDAEPEVFWSCSMDPQVKRDGPGSCPICGMDLIPVQQEATGGLRELSVTPAARELMRIRTVPVERRFVEAEVRMVGKIAYDETRRATITAWVPGRLDRLFVDYTGVAVRAGDHMVEMYSPELVAAQEELLQAKRTLAGLDEESRSLVRRSARDTLDAVREKLRLWGLTPDQIAAIEARGSATDHVTIYAPIGGIVTGKAAEKGMHVQTGTLIYTIDDLAHLWVKLDAYESDLPWLHYGQRVEFRSEAFPGETFGGTIAFIDPVLDDRTRTVKVRVNVDNPHGRLRPGMFVRGLVRAQVAAGGRVMDPDLAGKWMCPMHPDVVRSTADDCDVCGMPLVRTESLGYVPPEAGEEDKPLVIPKSAALVTGSRAIVYVELPDTEAPTFEGREVVLGPRAGDHYLVRSGLEEGELVVVEGNFKIDSALQIKARPSMMTPFGGGGGGHGGHGAAGGEPGAEPEMPVVPRGVLVKLQRIEQAYAALAVIVAASDLSGSALAEARAGFEALGAAAKEVEVEALVGPPKLVWKELAMRYANDAVEGGEAVDADEARAVFESLTTNVGWMRAELRTRPEPPPGGAKPPPELPQAASAALAGLWADYRAVHEALADDDPDTAGAAVKRARAHFAEMNGVELGERAAAIWSEERPSLEEAFTGMYGAADLVELRAAFALFSEEMPVVLRRFGAWGDEPVYTIECPMAFSGRGATWLQTDQKVRNPYYGSTMYSCGSVIDTLHEPVADAGTERDDEEDSDEER